MNANERELMPWASKAITGMEEAQLLSLAFIRVHSRLMRTTEVRFTTVWDLLELAAHE